MTKFVKNIADFITAVFSNPNVSEFLFWGFYADGNPKAIIYNRDWSLAPMGEAFYGLVHKKWKTELTSKTTHTGTLQARGFYGTYEYSYKQGSKTVIGTFELKKEGSKKIKIK